MNKKLASLVLSGLIVLNNTGSLENVYADSENKSRELIKSEDTKSTRIIYLADGEGSESEGNGTQETPFKNIRTALKEMQDGETLKLVGNVSYHYYEVGSEKDALPLFIDKKITIDGENRSSLYVRAPIQLGADVTFKDLRLEMVPQYTLGRILGQFIERSTTIYAAGHKLTLDNVNTKFGENSEQNKERPYISGGAYKNYNITGPKSVINIINSNDETKFSAIYAGDYYSHRTLDVGINIDGKAKVADNKIYTGGYNHDLDGDVTVNLGKGSSITKFDKVHHEGNLDVKLYEGTYISNFDATNINNLTLEENSIIRLSKNATFNVNNVVLKNKATIDFTDMMDDNLIVKGNFNGESITDNSKQGGTIVLGGSQVLDIQGKLSGTTILSESNTKLLENEHVYIKTHEVCDGTFILEDSISDYYELKQVQTDNGIDWVIEWYKEDFGDFEWVDNNKIEHIGEGSNSAKGIFKVKFMNTEGIEYIPFDELCTDFKYELTVLYEDGKEEEIDFDTQNSENIYLDVYLLGDELEATIEVDIKNMDKIKKMTLKVTHIETQKYISKDIYNDLTIPEVPEVDTPDKPETDAPEVDTPDVPETDAPEVDTPDKPETDAPEVDTPDVPETDAPEVDTPDKPETDVPEVDTPDKPETDVPEVDTPDVPETDAPEVDTPDVPETGVPEVDTPDVPETDAPEVDTPDVPETDEPEVDTPDVPETDAPEVDTPDKPETDAPEVDTPDVPETDAPEVDTPDKPETDAPEVDTPDVPETDAPEVDTPDKPETDVPEVDTPDKPETDVPEVDTPDVPETDAPEVDTPDKPETDAPEVGTPNTDNNIIENLPQIEGIDFGQGNATIESPLSVKVDTVEGLKELLKYTETSNFTITNVEEVKEKEDDNFLIYLIKITKKSIIRSEESYFMEIKVAKDNKEVIQQLETIVDKDNTNNGNDITVENESNNNTSNNKPNNNNNNTTNNNLVNNSNEANKEESPKTYDGGIGSYLLSGIGSIGLLSILSKNKKRKK